MLRHYSKKSEKKYNKLVKLNPNMQISGTRFFEWDNDTVVEFTCKYGHITDRELRNTMSPIVCQCDNCIKDRAKEEQSSFRANASDVNQNAKKNYMYRDNIVKEGRRLAEEYIVKNKLDISLCSKERRKNRVQLIEYNLLVAKHVHNFYYQYDMDKIMEDVKVSVGNKMRVTCPEHGEFKVLLSGHYGGTGCPKCFKQGKRAAIGRIAKPRRNKKQMLYLRRQIVKRSRELAGEYIIKNKIGIPTSIDKMRRAKYKNVRMHFHMIACQMVHNFYYKYDLTAWQNIKDVRVDKVPVTCPEHGVFYAKLGDHYAGGVCPKCSPKGKKEGRRVELPLEIEETF